MSIGTTALNETSTATAGPEPVQIRSRPCGCGCKGRDSWHRPTMDRVVRNVEILDDVKSARMERGGGFINVVAYGTVTVPWGAQRVGFRAYSWMDSPRVDPAGWVAIEE